MTHPIFKFQKLLGILDRCHRHYTATIPLLSLRVTNLSVYDKTFEGEKLCFRVILAQPQINSSLY